MIAAKLVKQPKPPNPVAAKKRDMEGTVRFNAVIGKQGRIDSLELVSGPWAFYLESRDNARRWQYNPTTLNLGPVEVVTVIDVNSTMSK